MSVPTPELDKRHDVAFEPRPPSEVLSEFWDWLHANGYEICADGYHEEVEEKCGVCAGVGKRMNPRQRQVYEEAWPIMGTVTWEQSIEERGQFLARLKDCKTCDGSGFVYVKHYRQGLVPFVGGPERLFARFFDIDLDKIETERRAILDELRSAF